jgi:parallel beta-helix repeat protein
MDYFVLPQTISGTQSYQYNTIVRDEVTVTSSSEMTVNSQYWDFYDGGNLIVSDNATLNINGATNVLAMRDEGQIELQGNMNVASGVSFDRRSALNLPHFTLFINNSSKNYAFSDFDFKGSMIGESNTLELDNIKFEASDIEYVGDLTLDGLDSETQSLTVDFQGGDLLVQNNDMLLNTYISASMPDANQNTIVIQDNLFRNTLSTENKAVISIDDYRIFSIENNEIEINQCNGIELYHAGNNIGADKIVTSNEIYSTNASNECRAIDVFFSRAEISNNNIYDNKYGVVAFGSSETTIMGNQDANSISETQQFIDNTIHCYFSYSSYPEDIRYNYFEHNATIDDPYVKLVYWDIEEPPAPPVDYSTIYNIECNAWYSTFDPEEDLVPNGSYDYDPYWNIGQYCVKDGGEAGALYDEAKEYLDSGYYTQADSNFKEIISDYPEDPHAIHSLRELYNMEDSTGNDYDSLRLYYKTVITADQDSFLCRSANWMSMHCLIMMDSTQKAIDWLDSTINVSQNTVDSIFAIINLGYIYTHFPDTTLKSTLYTTHNEYIPKSYADYKNKREQLFEKLLKSSTNENENEDLTIDKSATIMQLAPNPTKEAFIAKIEVETEGYLKIELFSSLGAKISEIDLGKVQIGIIEHSISLTNQPQGMYYVVIQHNNAVQETKKVIKM